MNVETLIAAVLNDETLRHAGEKLAKDIAKHLPKGLVKEANKIDHNHVVRALLSTAARELWRQHK